MTKPIYLAALLAAVAGCGGSKVAQPSVPPIISHREFHNELVDFPDGATFRGCKFDGCQWPERDTNWRAFDCEFVRCDPLWPLGKYPMTFQMFEGVVFRDSSYDPLSQPNESEVQR